MQLPLTKLLTALLAASFTLSGTAALASEIASEPIVLRSSDFAETAANGSQSLAGVEQRNSAEWYWAVGGEYEYAETAETESVYEQKDNFLDKKLQQLNLTLENSDRNLGDSQERPTRRFPFVHF